MLNWHMGAESGDATQLYVMCIMRANLYDAFPCAFTCGHTCAHDKIGTMNEKTDHIQEVVARYLRVRP
jgi:hypothetical protein